LLDPIDHLEDPAEQRPNLAADSFAGRTVLVVGGGGSIGAACAWLAARLGAQVVVAGRKPEKLQAVVKAMGERGLCAAGVPVDIRDRASVESLFDELAKRALPDLVVQSAGGQYPSAAIDIVEKGWKAVVDTNLTGSFNVMQCAAQRWRDAGRGAAWSISWCPHVGSMGWRTPWRRARVWWPSAKRRRWSGRLLASASTALRLV